MKKITFKHKMRALLEGLEIRKIDEFMENATVEDYRRLGKAYIRGARQWIPPAILKILRKEE